MFHIWNEHDPNMDLNSWLLFLRMVDLGGLSEASRRLGIPKSTLSRRLAKLEDEFGARLVNRRGRTFALTEAGRLFYEEASRLAGHVDAARERLSDWLGHEGGTIRMTAPKTPGGRFLGEWLARFLRQHPDIRIELDLSDRVANLVEQGYDLALRVGPLADSSLVARPLGSSERLLAAAPDCIARYGRPETPDQLAQLPCVGFGEQRSGHGTWLLKHGRRSQRVRYKPVLRCDDMATIYQAVLAGVGVALMPTFVCRGALESGALDRILPDWSGPTARFYLVYPERRLMPARVRLLIDFLIACGKADRSRL